jgi:hypothetical protein
MPIITQDVLVAAAVGYTPNYNGQEFAKIQTIVENNYLRPVLGNLYASVAGWSQSSNATQKQVYNLSVAFGVRQFMEVAVRHFGKSSLTASGLKQFTDGNLTSPSEGVESAVGNDYNAMAAGARNELVLYLNANAEALAYTGIVGVRMPNFGFSPVRGTSTSTNSN